MGDGRRWMTRAAFTALALFVGAGHGGAQARESPPLRSTLDSLVRAEIEANRVAGMTVGVVRGEDTLLLRGYGHADLEHRVPATSETVYQIASLTKQFTAAAVLRLVAEDRLDLDDALDRFDTGFPTRGRTVLIRQLLNHTSGVPDYYDLPGWPEIRPLRLEHDEGRDAMVGLVAAEPFDFEPGTEVRYSNAGYDLLGDIVEIVSETDYWTFLRRELFEPLGLERTSGCPWPEVIRHRARGYVVEDSVHRNAHRISQSILFGSGSLCSTARDLLAWTRLLHDGRVLPPELYHHMTTPEGAASGWGYGLEVKEVEGHRVLRHNGYAMGFASQLEYFPADELSVAVLANTPARVAGLAEALARATLGLPPSPEPVFPEGWVVRTPAGRDPGEAVFFRRMGQGVHVTAGPTAVYFHPDSTVRGAFRVSGSFWQAGDPSPEEGHGIVLGVGQRPGMPPAYVYFLVRGDGRFAVGRAVGGAMEPLIDWRRHEAVPERPPGLSARTELAVEAGAGSVRFLVEGREVARVDRSRLPPVDGVYGFRIGRDDDIHVADFGR